jgi:hypothetical protein
MKIQAVQAYRGASGYPTLAEIQRTPELLARVPARWEQSSGFAALLGLLALATAPRAEAADEAVPVAAPAAASPDAQPSETAVAQQARKTAAVVAPMLEEALDQDGRGSFGCISVCPATFMPEDEALELIRTELEAAGLRLQEGVELDNVMAPVQKPEDAKPPSGPRDWEKGNELGPRPVRFDWADPERAVYVDYLAQRDYRTWQGRMVSVNNSFDFAALARKVAEAYGQHPATNKTVFGVFFEPLADPGVAQPKLEGLSSEQARRASWESERLEAAIKGEKSRDKLRRQVRHFVEFLKKEGVVGAPP